MITTDIKELANSDGLPVINKDASDYLLVAFTFEYLKMSGVLDSMRMNGMSESFISGYIEGVFSALQTIDRLANPQDLYE
ncbi:TPA: phage protein [Yersinia enterocolitica]|nr:DUF2717 domain-containing protein [Yersinia enterocolitica]